MVVRSTLFACRINGDQLVSVYLEPTFFLKQTNAGASPGSSVRAFRSPWKSTRPFPHGLFITVLKLCISYMYFEGRYDEHWLWKRSGANVHTVIGTRRCVISTCQDEIAISYVPLISKYQLLRRQLI